MGCADLALPWLFISLDRVFHFNVAASTTTFSSRILLTMSDFATLIYQWAFSAILKPPIPAAHVLSPLQLNVHATGIILLAFCPSQFLLERGAIAREIAVRGWKLHVATLEAWYWSGQENHNSNDLVKYMSACGSTSPRTVKSLWYQQLIHAPAWSRLLCEYPFGLNHDD